MSNPAILIVEDEAIVAADLANKVRQLGYAVAGSTATGEAAVDLARQLQPALVLMDIRLAGAMDGIAAADAIRRECQVPVVFLTAHSDRATVEGARQVDALGYILKPFETHDLQIQIEMALYKHAAERRLRESEARLAGIVGSAMDAIISVDEQQRIVLFNAAAETIFGLPAAATLGQPLAQLIPEPVRRAHATHLSRFAQTETGLAGRQMGALGEIRGRRANGEEFPIEASISRVMVAGRNLFTVTLRDITVRKQAEEALRSLTAELEQRVQERTAELQRVNASLLQEMAQRRELEHQVLEISEREQRRIGQDLHDGIGQSLVATRLQVEALCQRLAKQHLPDARQATKIAHQLQQALEDARQIARGLHPVRPGAESLMAALYELAAGVPKLSKISCRFTCRGRVLVPDHPAAINLYRIAQEAVNNAVRHAQPKHIHITLAQTTVGVRLRVADDGRGLPTAAKRAAGLGLGIMRYRASIIGATCAIGPRRGRGTVVTCDWQPSPPESHAK